MSQHRHWFSSITAAHRIVQSGNFLSIEQAREYVRRLKFKRFTCWEKWIIAERPPSIPSRPDKVYRDTGWISFPDFLGYERRPIRYISKNDLPQTNEPERNMFTPQGLASLSKWVHSIDPNLECRYLPRRLQANMMVRYRNSDDWVALRVMTEHKEQLGRELRFSSIRGIRGDILLCLVRSHCDAFVIVDDVSKFVRPGPQSCAANMIQFPKKLEESVERIRQACHDPALTKGFWEWLTILPTHENIGEHLRVLRDIDAQLYRIAGVHLHFPLPTAVKETVMNSYLGDLRCIHRKARRHPTGGYSTRLYRQRNCGVHIYYGVDDAFDVLVVSIYRNESLEGLFVFPKHVIASFLDGIGGKPLGTFLLYPPFRSVDRKSSIKVQAWQDPYYVDLSDRTQVDESVKKFLRILEEAKALVRLDASGEHVDPPEMGIEDSTSMFQSKGVIRLKEWFEEANPDFECRYLPKKLRANILIRYRKENWRAIRILTEQKDKAGRPLRFTTSLTPGAVVVCLARRVHNSFAILETHQFDSFNQKHTIDPDVFARQAETFISKMRDLCMDESRTKSMQDWLFTLTEHAGIQAHIKNFVDLDNHLYQPANMPLRFPPPHFVQTSCTNSYLGHYRCIHKKVNHRTKRPFYVVDLFRRAGSSDYVAFRQDERFDFLIVGVYERDDIRGVFVFPKRILFEKLALTVSAKKSMPLYPTFVQPVRRQAKVTKGWQQNYYIDFSRDIDESIEKFHSILKCGNANKHSIQNLKPWLSVFSGQSFS